MQSGGDSVSSTSGERGHSAGHCFRSHPRSPPWAGGKVASFFFSLPWNKLAQADSKSIMRRVIWMGDYALYLTAVATRGRFKSLKLLVARRATRTISFL